MAKTNTSVENNSCDGYGCGDEVKMTCKHGSLKHHILKKIIWIFIVIVAFCFGVQFGELRGMMKIYSHKGAMMQWDGGARGAENNYYKVGAPDASNTTKETLPAVKETTPKQ
ncbi:MAG: hypothetical protein WC059_03475 [Candidatus Paceibacterota bacterium]